MIPQEMVDLMQGVAEGFEAHKKKVTERLDVIERKANKLAFSSTTDTEAVDGEASFRRCVKSWYPARAGEQLAALDYLTYKSALTKYVRHGLDSLSIDERKAMQVGVDPDGGFLASGEIGKIIVRTEGANSVMRKLARILPAGSDAIEYPASLTRPEVGWVGETTSRDDTDTPTLGKLRYEPKEIYANPAVTQKLLDDADIDIEAFLGEEIGLAFAQSEDAKFIAGDGVLVPRGFTTYTTAATSDSAGTRAFGTIEHIATGQAGAWPTTTPLLYDKLVDVIAALRPRYRQNATWVMGTEAIAKLRKMKTTTTDEPIWQPSMLGGQPDLLLGYPVAEAEQMPAVGANSYSVAFGDWKRGYWIHDRTGVRILRDPYTSKPYVKFYTTKRLTGGLADSCAIKLLKFATT